MSHPLRLLIVDDNPDDRALVIRELRREFAEAEIEQVVDSQGFDRVLQFPRLDLVITDYQLLWTHGLNVLKQVKRTWPDCPVIMFTGTGSEEIAVEAMKAGLDDYVLKSPKHYARLPAAAKLALKMGRQRRELKDSEKRYTTLFDTVPLGLFRATPEGRILDANPALLEILEYPDQRMLLSINLEELYPDSEIYHQWRGAMERDEVVHGFETQWRCFDGRLSWVQLSTKAISDQQTRSVVYEGSVENISRRKQADVEREELITELQEALTRIKTLSGLLPICASCKRIRDDRGDWNQIEVFIQGHSDAEFTHSFCPECMRHLYPEVFELGGRK
jgi:PAS domain S-box-containing protein